MDGGCCTRAGIIAVLGVTAVLVLPSAGRVEAATFVVNDTRDRVDSRPGNGVCRTSAGTCTLRAAVQEANDRAGADVITLRSGTYTITRAPVNANDVTTGDVDITDPLTINGAGAGVTVVDGGTPPVGTDSSRTALDRIFEVHPSAGDVSLSRLTVREGWDEKEGGAISTRSAGAVRLAEVSVLGSFAGTAGGGIYFDGFDGGSLTIERSSIVGNSTNGEGGGIHVASGRLTVSGTVAVETTIADNSARHGGGIYNAGGVTNDGQAGRVRMSHATVARNTAVGMGGGIASGLGGSLNLSDTVMNANHAGGDGGGVATTSKSELTANLVTFTANRADGSGGGAFAQTDGPVEVDGSTFTVNRAVGEGGGIAIDSNGPVAISDTRVSGNTSLDSGGGVLASGLSVDLTRLVVTGNTAVVSGGGVDNQGSGELALVDSEVSSNVAADGAGFANRADGTLRVVGSTFAGNVASNTGGGFLHQSDAATEIENVTLSGNVARFNGGGLYLDADAGLRVVNTTITANAAPHGSGVGTADPIDNFPVQSHPLLVFRNTIVAGNVGGSDCHAGFGSEGGNLDGGTLCNFGGPRDRANVVPALGPLADNGGPTRTHALSALSPAVGGGVEPCPVTDQRGVERELERPCDVGSFEFAGTPEVRPPDERHPETRLDSGPSGTTQSSEATFAFSSDDEQATFECSLDGAERAGCTSPVVLNDLAPGTHTFVVRAVDAAGNVDPTPAGYMWTIEDADAPAPDHDPPETAFDSTPPVVTQDVTATFRFSADEPGATFACAVDGGAFELCTSPVELSGLDAATHSFAVRATDPAGNVEPEPALHTWTVETPGDTAPPETLLSSGPASPTQSTSAQFTFSSSESDSTFQCALDGGSFAACTSPTSYAGLQANDHTFDVRAIDPAGNVDPTPESYVWTIEAPAQGPPPVEVSFDAGPPSPTEQTSARFSVSASVAGARLECSLDEASFVACVSPIEYAGLAVGEHTLDVRATDQAGNVDTARYGWTIVAPPACPAPTTVAADADAWIDQNSSGTNKGSDSILKLQSKAPRDNFRALVHFPLPALPAGCVVESATVSLFAASSSPDRRLQLHRLADGWSEHGVTWDNQPATTGDAVLATSGNGYREWTATTHVQAMYSTGTNHGFVVRDEEGGDGFEQQLHSREKGETPPLLVVRYAIEAP